MEQEHVFRRTMTETLQKKKILMLGKIEGRRRGNRGCIIDSMGMILSKLREIVKDREA